jgi:integrase
LPARLRDVVPVPQEIIERTLPHLSAQCQTMVRLQHGTGMGSGEVVRLRPCDVNISTTPWVYVPGTHKTEHHDKDRVIPLGPKARAILQPWPDRDAMTLCFSPAEAEQARNAKRRLDARSSRRTTRRATSRKRPPSQGYTTDSYRRAIVGACEIAFEMPDDLRIIPSSLSTEEKSRRRDEASQWRAQNCWTPHQLRHNFGTD